MKKILRHISSLSVDVLFVLTVISLAGCSAKTKVKVLPVKVYEPLPRELLVDDIIVPRPPDRETFINSDPIERELMLSNKLIDLYKVISQYKLKLKGIRNYDTNISNTSKKEYERILKENKWKD